MNRRLSSTRIAALFPLCGLVLASVSSARPVSMGHASDAARAQLARMDRDDLSVVGNETVVSASRAPLAFLFTLAPTGYVVVAADDALPPVIAYSPRDPAPISPAGDPLRALLRADLAARLAALPPGASAHPGWSAAARVFRFEQWPPEGSTPTGGWVEVRWSQGSPYNQFCPRDLAHGGGRSVAGCPAVAMGQILDYLRTGAEVRFADGDDYTHSYYGNTFRIDDDHLAYDFPAWPQLNDRLGTLQARWSSGLESDAVGAASLVFACGVAAHQVYSVYGSGTFGVDQALMAYQRFGFADCELLAPEVPELLARMADDMRLARPAHLAVVNPDWTAGHNMVVDGWNSDGFFHVNFGWGGPYDGWYLLPASLPYNLTVIEGVIVNIKAHVTAAPETPATLVATAWPNPGNPMIVIGFELSLPAVVRLDLFDARGRLVRRLLDGPLPAGPGSARWDGTDSAGQTAAAGVYLYRVRADDAMASGKISLAR